MRYKKKPDKNTEVTERIKYWSEKRIRYGTPRIHIMLLRDGFKINHKRTERIYKSLGLSLRKKKKRKYRSEVRLPAPTATERLDVLSMDFMSDRTYDGKKLRFFTLEDIFTRECHAIEVDTSLTGYKVVQFLEQLKYMEGLPRLIMVDNGPEFICIALDKWAYQNDVKLSFSRPGKPTDNPFIESFNGKLRDECLETNWFLSLEHARKVVEEWRNEYNESRPHSSLDNLTPKEFVEKIQGTVLNVA